MSFLEDFKKFAFKGNVIDLAIGVVIGSAFGKIVTAVVSDVFMPLVSLAMPNGDWRTSHLVLRVAADPKNNIVLNYGDLLGATLDFLIVALALFVFVSRIMRAAEERLHPRKDQKPAEPVIKECPYCFETIPIKATRCKACTSQLPTSVANAPSV